MKSEKRCEERIALEAPVNLGNTTGMTRDISPSGIYFVTDQQLQPGNAINFSVPLDYVCPGKPIILECQGLILRVEVLGEKIGVAARIQECWCTQAVH